jgi:hypothetical protein
MQDLELRVLVGHLKVSLSDTYRIYCGPKLLIDFD